MTDFLQQLIIGLRLGSVYALVALGYTMVYGIAKMLSSSVTSSFAMPYWISS